MSLDAIINYFEYIFDDQTPLFKMADEISRAIKALCLFNKEAVMFGGRLTSSTGGLILQIVVLYWKWITPNLGSLWVKLNFFAWLGNSKS